MKMEFQRKDERQLLPEPGKTPREHAEDYLLSILDKLPPAARRDAVDFCRLVVRKYDPDYGEGARR